MGCQQLGMFGEQRGASGAGPHVGVGEGGPERGQVRVETGDVEGGDRAGAASTACWIEPLRIEVTTLASRGSNLGDGLRPA